MSENNTPIINILEIANDKDRNKQSYLKKLLML